MLLKSIIYQLWKLKLYIKHYPLVFGLIIACLFLLLTGCGSSTETTIKEKTISIPVPDIKAEMPAEIKGATPNQEEAIKEVFKQLPPAVYFEGETTITDTVTGRKTKIKSKFFPAAKDSSGNIKPRFEDEVKQDPVKASVQDKTKVIKESTWDKIIIAASIIGFIVLVIAAIKFFRK